VSSSSLDSLSAAQPKAKRATLEALEAREANSDLRLIYLLRNRRVSTAEVNQDCFTQKIRRIKERGKYGCFK
jgi:hypothetical protein